MKLLAIDIGNSSAKFGLFIDNRLDLRSSATTRDLASGMIPEKIAERLSHESECIIASVVPEAVEAALGSVRGLTGRDPLVVDHSLDFGMEIDYRPKEDCGIDRLLAAAAAGGKHGGPCVVCDFGTATTIDAVDAGNVYRGGIIAPGVRTFAESLHRNTSKLPLVEPEPAYDVIGNSTRAAILAGTHFGYKGLVEEIVSRMQARIGESAPVVATGGFAEYLDKSTSVIDEVEPDLVLKGLALVHRRNAA